MFWASSCLSSGATTAAVAASAFTVGPVKAEAGRPDHDQQHCYHHAGTVKPEAATAVVAPDDGHEDTQNMLSCI
jgi:hypothetical protein